jgi:hypothetical protein
MGEDLGQIPFTQPSPPTFTARAAWLVLVYGPLQPVSAPRAHLIPLLPTCGTR